MTTNHAYALIMAGGSGTRLWPLSREGRPKPVLPLVERRRSMFQIAVERLNPLFTPDRIYVVANETLTIQLHDQAPQIPDANFIIEPEGRDTAPAIGLGAIHIHHRDPEAVMVVLTADHYIADEEIFRTALEVACRVAAQGSIVMLGIEPDHPSTGFGYIERGEMLETHAAVEVYQLARFAEKPDLATAEQFLAAGNYSWNSGMFIWQTRRILDEFRQHTPALAASLDEFAALIGQPIYNERLNRSWPGLQKISIDFALMEHIADNVAVIPVQMGWADIGSFSALYDILVSEDESNVSLGNQNLLLDTANTFIHSDRLVAVIGLDDLVIVDTEDVLLVCKRDRAQDVKKLVEILKESQRTQYL